MIIVTGRMKLRHAEVREFTDAATLVAARTREEPGCVEYRFAIDIEDPLTIQLFELWDSPTALQEHFATPHFRAFAAVLAHALDGDGQFTKFEVSDSAPLFA